MISGISFTVTPEPVREGVPSQVNLFDVLTMSAISGKQAAPPELVVTPGPSQAEEAPVHRRVEI